MWWVTICKGDYRLPVKFSDYRSASEFMESIFTADEYEDIVVVLTVTKED